MAFLSIKIVPKSLLRHAPSSLRKHEQNNHELCMDGKRQRNRPTFCPEGCSMGIRHTYYCALQPLLQNLFIVKTTANKTIASHRIEREREKKRRVASNVEWVCCCCARRQIAMRHHHNWKWKPHGPLIAWEYLIAIKAVVVRQMHTENRYGINRTRSWHDITLIHNIPHKFFFFACLFVTGFHIIPGAPLNYTGDGMNRNAGQTIGSGGA